MIPLRGNRRGARAPVPHRRCALSVQAWLCLAVIHTGQAAVSEPATEIEEIIVTGVREQMLRHLPQNATVISRRDIELAPSNNLIDLIAREANITLRTYTGTDKFGGVDIRGMGDTYTSNVLVLVNGRKLNSADLSGADLSSIPLWQVERIEIVRGANTVRYGDGAVAGVINILTRQPEQAATATVQRNEAAYGSHEYGVNVTAGAGMAAFNLSANRYQTEGYRDNGQLEKDDIGVGVDLTLTPTLQLNAEARQHRDSYGLPGPVSREAMRGSNAQRRASSSPDDGGDTEDEQASAELRWAPDAHHALRLLAFGRHRENRFINGYSPLITEEDQRSLIEEKTASLELLYSYQSSGWQLDLGASGRDSDYARYQDGIHVVGQSTRKLGALDNRSGFVAGAWHITPTLTLNAGYRLDHSRIDQRDKNLAEVCDNGAPVFIPGLPPIYPDRVCHGELQTVAVRNERWKNHAHELGAVWSITPAASVYASQADTFRNPNVDELVLAGNQLGPQTGSNTELGLRYQMTPALYATLSAYRMRFDDEIFYDGLVNRNSDEPTERKGLEFELRWQLHTDLKTWFNASVSRNRFEVSGSKVPLVPEQTATLGFEYTLLRDLSIAGVGKYVGPRYDGNDLSNRLYPELPGYQTWDFKLMYRRPTWQLSAGLNNAFDKVYAASAYGGMFYPMPGRNGYVGITLSF